MAEIVIKGDKSETIMPVLDSAIRNQLKLLNTSINRTKTRINSFEREYVFKEVMKINNKQGKRGRKDINDKCNSGFAKRRNCADSLSAIFGRTWSTET
jgi:hypothetical protein